MVSRLLISCAAQLGYAAEIYVGYRQYASTLMSDLTGLVFNLTVFYHAINYHLVNSCLWTTPSMRKWIIGRKQHQRQNLLALALDRVQVDVLCRFKRKRIVSSLVGCSTDALIQRSSRTSTSNLFTNQFSYYRWNWTMIFRKFINGFICEVVCAAKSVRYAHFIHSTARLLDLIKLGRICGTSHQPTGFYELSPRQPWSRVHTIHDHRLKQHHLVHLLQKGCGCCPA